MGFKGGVIMGYIDKLAKLDRAGDRLHSLLDPFHHQPAVGQGKGHAVVHLAQILFALGAVNRQIGELLISRDRGPETTGPGYRKFIIEVCNPVSQVPAAGMDHDPYKAVTALLDFDEMIASAQGAKLGQSIAIFTGDNLQVGKRHSFLRRFWHHLGVLRFPVMFKSHRNTLSDQAHNPFELFAVQGTQRCFLRAHAASYVHPDRIGNNRPFGGHDPAYGHAVSHVGIGHNGNVTVNKGQVGNILCLFHCPAVNVFQPKLDRFVFSADYLLHPVSLREITTREDHILR